jgi:hypothetical protein
MAKIVRLTEADLTRLVRRVINEDINGSKTFEPYDIKSFKERGFKINPQNNEATLKHPKTGMIYMVKPCTKPNCDWTIIKNNKTVYEGPHDDCDVKLDELIGYNFFTKYK